MMMLMNELAIHKPWVLGFSITLCSYMVILGIRKLLCDKVLPFVTRKQSHWDELIIHTLKKTTHLFMFGLALYIAYHYVPHKAKYNLQVNRVFFTLTMFQVAIWLNHLVDKWITLFVSRKTRKNPAAQTSISFMQMLVKLVIISLVFLMTLNNLGIKVTTILAGFGVGGIAVALAMQKILGDFFSSLSIMMDKPFVVGDFIIIDQYLGEVEKIGMRTTQLRSLGGEQIIISNSDILAARIRNYKRMRERRIVQKLSFVLGTGPEKMKQAVSIVKAAINSRPLLRLERCHFSAIGPSSVDIETVYWVLNEDYTVHMDVQEEVLLELYSVLHQEGLTFATPTQTMHLEPKEFFLKNLYSEEKAPKDQEIHFKS